MKNIVYKICLIVLCLIVLIVPTAIYFNYSYRENNIEQGENNKDIIVINKLDFLSQAKLDVDIRTAESSSISTEYPFINNIKLPEGMVQETAYLVYTRKDVNTSEYDVLHDYVLNYGSADYQKSAIIAFSKDFKPLRDYFITDDNLAESKIKNVSLEILNHEEMYITTFTYNSLNFDIETVGLSEQEVISLLKSIINS